MSEEELRKNKLEQLKATRGGHRGVLTKRIGDVKEILQGGTLNDEQVTQLDV